MNSGTLVGTVAVVTGAGSGVGREIALQLVRSGSTVYALGRRAANLEETRSLAKEFSNALNPYEVDIGNETAVLQFRDTVARIATEVNILVHSAGVFARGTVESASIADLDSQYHTNLRGPWILTRALLPIIKSDAGEVVLINSSAGLMARAEVGQYAATKHALRALADSLREEVNTKGIRVLTVYLGRTATPMQLEVHKMENKPYRPETLIQPSDVASVVLYLLTLPRTAEVTDVTMRPLAKGR